MKALLLQTMYTDETARIQLNQEQSYLELEWFTHPDSTHFRAVITRARDYAHQHQLTKWLCNLQQAEFLELADQHWLVAEIFSSFPASLQHDYAYLIRPMVLEVLATYHIQDLVAIDERLQAKIQVAVFTDVDLAHQWLFTPTESFISSPIPHP
ncbi:hypothetical protein [Adhaeribacter radiodurans]|uniref:STAS/SEC14 domain-containing protein n=1 Tax=Adhaeribacter radiodurans TaxID=2745197 RepID=A0A7L7L145_9BACT|nr:hypothetical protein [Adhaeribacter radiodurans]QMU26511.1 hypothetical protein HUW48_00110 [Adhaeribacter radiodurans]